MGAMGAAGAVAGLGTSALFTDTEEFANNQLTAGELDLKMDWEEHYSFPQIYDDFSDPTVENGTELDVTRSDPNDDRYVGLPYPDDPVIWANASDNPTGAQDGPSSLELYFRNTTIEAFPDRAGGEVRGTFVGTTSGGDPVVNTPCETLADVPEPGLETYNDQASGVQFNDPGRTLNDDTYDSANEDYYPLLNLQDVKPGDFGEFTFSAHLCDNPGYLWLQMPTGLDESENGIVDPEDDVDTSPDDAELAENIQTALWYDDDCNNRIDTDNDVVALAIIDTSGSTTGNLQDARDAADELIKQLKDDQTTEARVYAGFLYFSDEGDTNDVLIGREIQNISNYSDTFFNDNPNSLPDTNGNSPLPHALDVGREYLNDVAADLAADPGNNVSDPGKHLLLVSDGDPVYDSTGSLSDIEGELRESAPDQQGNPTQEGNLFSYNGTTYSSDYFDGRADGNFGLTLPNPNDQNQGGTQRAETALVARDIDGEPFLQGFTQYEQTAAAKVDRPNNQPVGGSPTDPADISGENDITVHAAAVYPSGSPGDANETMELYATDSGVAYDLPAASDPTDIGRTIADKLNVGGSGETVIFNGSLLNLASELDPDQNGPLQLESEQPDNCYSPGATYCFGLAWWVPTSVGNEIQSDSVSFDLGFVTQQCRNNPDPDPPV
jgi:predicted ribosomally synthesized peptide with SipW-like signal peptide